MGNHVSVMLNEAISLLGVKDGGTYVDLTLGRGGHSSSIMGLNPHGRLYAFDIDEDAIRESATRLSAIGNNFTLIRDNFRNVKEALAEEGVGKVDGILIDLGVSSPQFDDAERGFSYRFDAPLDMRMDQRNSLTAKEIVNAYSYEQLKRVFKEYGEDPDSAKIALKIVKTRDEEPILTTGALVDLIKSVKPPYELRKKGHPAKQIFQALRIEVNDEMGNLKQVLQDAPYLLKEGGRFVVISFQSLEDRLVKDRFRELTSIEGTRYGPESLKKEEETEFELLTRHALAPSEPELENNHRANSAKLRAIAKKGAKQ